MDNFALILEYLQLEIMETDGTQLNLKQARCVPLRSCIHNRQRHSNQPDRVHKTWQPGKALLPTEISQSKRKDLSGKHGINCFLLV